MYMVRRYLFFTWDEWERLPGYQQQAYVAQLEQAKPWTTDGGDDGKGAGAGRGARELDISQPLSGGFGA